MAGLGNKVKLAVFKGMEAVGHSASNLANNAQQKLQELNLETQRREILSDFPLRAYDLWQKGETLPEPLDKMLRELSELDERLGVLRAQRYAQVEVTEQKDEEAAETAEGADETAPEGDANAAGQPEQGGEESVEAPQPEEAQADSAPMDEGETGDNA